MSKEKNKNIEEYLSDVRHDLRSELVVIREGISQVLDGLAGNDWSKCFDILKGALKGADTLNQRILDLLDPNKLKPILKDQGKSPSGDKDLEVVKDQLVSMISHRVRTPLTIIKEGVSLVLDEIPGGLNAEQKKFLADAKQNIDRLVESVEEILKTPWGEIAKSYSDSFPNEIKKKEK